MAILDFFQFIGFHLLKYINWIHGKKFYIIGKPLMFFYVKLMIKYIEGNDEDYLRSNINRFGSTCIRI